MANEEYEYKLVKREKGHEDFIKSEEWYKSREEALLRLNKRINAYKAVKVGHAKVEVKEDIVIFSGQRNEGGCSLEEFYEEFTIVRIIEFPLKISEKDIKIE
jgi:hypothetical protein